MSTSYQLTVNDLRIWLHLGYSDAERVYPQAVSLSIELHLPAAVYFGPNRTVISVLPEQ